MQLSPKSIFIGLVALGLPIAVAVGWNLAGPGKQPITATQEGGTGGIGAAAPAEGAGDGEPYSVRYSARPYSSPVILPSSSALPSASAAGPASVVPSGSPSVTPPAPIVSSSTVPLPPVLNEPPVPTPTEITEVPVPSGSASADPSTDPVGQP